MQFGGVPFYASKIDASKSVKQNVIDLILDECAIFEDEITFILSQEVRSFATYGRILNAIASGATKLNEISSKSGTSNSGMAYLLKLDDFKGQDFSIEMYH